MREQDRCKMASELSIASASDVATPIAPRSRRLSTLPVTNALPSSPTAARHQLLELEVLGLSEELQDTEKQKSALQAEVDALRSQLASSASSASSSSSSAQQLLVSSSSSTDSMAGIESKQRSLAELKAAKRLLHRLVALMTSHDPSSSSSSAFSSSASPSKFPLSTEDQEERFFNLDQSLIHDPERSILLPSSTHISTPNGKTPVRRSFESDLLDDIDSVRAVWEDYARKASFSTIEHTLQLQDAHSQIQALSSQLEHFQSEHASTTTLSASLAEREQTIVQLNQSLSAAEQRETLLQTQLEAEQTRVVQVETTLQETRAKLDQVTAEQELTIQAAARKSAAQTEALQLEIEELRSAIPQVPQLQDARIAELELQLQAANEKIAAVEAVGARTEPDLYGSERLVELEAELSLTKEELERLKTESTSQINALHAELDQRRTKSSDLHSIVCELTEKKERLHAIQLHNNEIQSLQRVLTQQERLVSLLDRSSDSSNGMHDQWAKYAHELTASLAQLKLPAKNVEVEKSDAATMTDAPTEPEQVAVEQNTGADSSLVAKLQTEVDELQARVLRRDEQIGYLQLQRRNARNDLERTRMNLTLAEATVVELDAEKAEHLEQIDQLEDRLASLSQLEQNAAGLDPAQVEALVEDKRSLQAEKVELEARVEQLIRQVQMLEQTTRRNPDLSEAESQTINDTPTPTPQLHDLKTALSTAEERISTLSLQLSELSASKAALQSAKEELDNTVSTLGQKASSLQEALSASSDAAKVVEQQEEELSALKSALHKAEDRLSNRTLELDALQLALAEQRESASEDTEKIDTLQSQLSTLESEHSALVSSSASDRTALDEARAQLVDLGAKISILEKEADTSASKLAELEEEKAKMEGVLGELTAKQGELERVLGERDEAIRVRNAEYWTLKEELAELQEEAERSKPDLTSSTTLAELQERLANSEAERATLCQRITAQEAALLKLKADLTSARSTEELLNEQYTAAQRRLLSLEQQPVQDDELKAKLAAAEEEGRYLQGRIEELEQELGHKADEIEEADSKILDALKESKKYATRYGKLSARYEAVQAELKVVQEQVRAKEGEVEMWKAAAAKVGNRLGGTGSASHSGVAKGRKRSKPEEGDDEEQLQEQVGERERAESKSTSQGQGLSVTPLRTVKAVYAPSPSHPPSTFTPVRRSALLHKPTSSHHLHSKPHTPIVLGHGTPTAPPPPTTTTTTTTATMTMTRSSSNPSELIAARLTTPASPGKPLLSDKTNLATSGISRLSSKPHPVSTTSALDPAHLHKLSDSVPSKLLPSVEKYTPNHAPKSAPAPPPPSSVGAAAGAADFLARMKAQRAAART